MTSSQVGIPWKMPFGFDQILVLRDIEPEPEVEDRPRHATEMQEPYARAPALKDILQPAAGVPSTPSGFSIDCDSRL